jgi:hypothetical protein
VAFVQRFESSSARNQARAILIEKPQVEVEEITSTYDPVKRPESERKPNSDVILGWDVDEDGNQEAEPGYNVLYNEYLVWEVSNCCN